MTQVLSTFSGLGLQGTVSAVGSASDPVSLLGTSTPTIGRQGVVISNPDTSTYVRLYAVPKGTAAASVAAKGIFDYVPPKGALPVAADGTVDLYVQSDGVGAITVGYSEVD